MQQTLVLQPWLETVQAAAGAGSASAVASASAAATTITAVSTASASAPAFATPPSLLLPPLSQLLFTLRQRLKLPKCYKFFVVKRS